MNVFGFRFLLIYFQFSILGLVKIKVGLNQDKTKTTPGLNREYTTNRSGKKSELNQYYTRTTQQLNQS